MNKNEQKSTQELTPMQEKVATLLARGMSITSVASECNLNRGTIYNWYGLDAFRECYQQACDEFRYSVKSDMLNIGLKALDVITFALESNDEGVRTKVAMWLMDDARSMIRRELIHKLSTT